MKENGEELAELLRQREKAKDNPEWLRKIDVEIAKRRKQEKPDDK